MRESAATAPTPLEINAKGSRTDALPANLPPRGLKREAAAAYVGVSPTTFDAMVNEGVMPRPWRYRSCARWDRLKLDAAMDKLDIVDASEEDYLGATQ